MKGEIIKIACEGAALLDLDDLAEFQGDLKSLSKKNYEKLRKEILDTGLGFPFRIWRHEGKLNIIGGHQTKRTLVKMRDEEGYEVPRVPVSFVEARDLQEAKRRVLQDVAQYGQIERQGLYEFLHESEIDFKMIEESFELPNIDMESFKFEYFKDPEPLDGLEEQPSMPQTRAEVVEELDKRSEDKNPFMQDRDTYLNNNIKQIVLFYDTKTFEQIISSANRLLVDFGLDDFSALFQKLVKDNTHALDGIESAAQDDQDQGIE